ncbi:MAG: hypothetical protein IT426_16135 [Pirellulales bacterium]|nr:hypothetical protein [Pirellulales bacterium]
MTTTAGCVVKSLKHVYFIFAVVFAAALGFAALDSKAFAEPAKDDLVDPAMRKELLTYLEDIDQYILSLDLGSDSLKIENKNDSDSLYINGNFARVLVASSRITGNKAYLREAVRWCDAVYNKQELAITSQLEEGGFWVDFATAQNIYFGDAGTGSTAMAIIYRETDDPQRKKLYRAAMDRYARFVMQGTLVDPQRKDRKTTKTWIIADGPDKGALGCGYYRGHLSVAPYTISTATTGGAFFSHFYEITGKPEYKEIAANAVKWIFTARKPDGEIRYILDNRPEKDFSWPLDTIAYCAEAYITADKYLGDAELKQQLRRETKLTVEWLLKNQNDDGSWGKLRSADQQRSPGAVALLSWYYRQVERDPKVAESVRKYCRFLLNPENSAKYGVKQLIRTTGFVGLVVADIVQPESIF